MRSNDKTTKGTSNTLKTQSIIKNLRANNVKVMKTTSHTLKPLISFICASLSINDTAL